MFMFAVASLQGEISIGILEKIIAVFEWILEQEDFYTDSERFNYNNHKWLRELRRNEHIYLSPTFVPTFSRLLHVFEKCYRRRIFITGSAWCSYLHTSLKAIHGDTCGDTGCLWLAHECDGYQTCTSLRPLSPPLPPKRRLSPDEDSSTEYAGYTTQRQQADDAQSVSVVSAAHSESVRSTSILADLDEGVDDADERVSGLTPQKSRTPSTRDEGLYQGTDRINRIMKGEARQKIGLFPQLPVLDDKTSLTEYQRQQHTHFPVCHDSRPHPQHGDPCATLEGHENLQLLLLSSKPRSDDPSM